MRMCVCLRLGLNVAVMVRVEVRVWTRRWLVVIRQLVVRVSLIDGSRKWRRRNGRVVVSGARARGSGGMLPMMERGRRAGSRVRARMGGWQGTLLREGRKVGQDTAWCT